MLSYPGAAILGGNYYALASGANVTHNYMYRLHELIPSMYRSADAVFYSRDQESRAVCLPETRSLEIAEILTRLEPKSPPPDTPQTIIVHGPSQVGKSTLLRTVVRTVAAATPFIFLSFAFPSDGTSPQIASEQVVPTLLAQLLWHPAIEAHIRSVTSDDPDIFSKSLSFQAAKLLFPALCIANDWPSVVKNGLLIVFDDIEHLWGAGDRQRVLQLFEQLASQPTPHIKLLTSLCDPHFPGSWKLKLHPIAAELLKSLSGSIPSLCSERQPCDSSVCPELKSFARWTVSRLANHLKSGPTPRICWLFKTGDFKSCDLVPSVIEKLRHKDIYPLATFCWNHRVDFLLERFIPTIASQLSSAYPDASQRVVEAINRNHGCLSEPMAQQITRLITEPLVASMGSHPCSISITRRLIVVGGFDQLPVKEQEIQLQRLALCCSALAPAIPLTILLCGEAHIDSPVSINADWNDWVVRRDRVLEESAHTTTASAPQHADMALRIFELEPSETSPVKKGVPKGRQSLASPTEIALWRSIPIPSEEVQKYRKDGIATLGCFDLSSVTAPDPYSKPMDTRATAECHLRLLSSKTVPLPPDLVKGVEFYMRSNTDPRILNLWSPFPQSGTSMHIAQKSISPGDIVMVTSESGEMRLKPLLNIFYSKSENLFYGNETPAGYVALGPPMRSYQGCIPDFAGQVDVWHTSTENCTIGPSRSSQGAGRECLGAFTVQPTKNKKDALSGITFLPRGWIKHYLALGEVQSQIADYIMDQGAEWFEFYSKSADLPLKDDALILVTGAYMAQTWGAGYVHRRAHIHTNSPIAPIEIALYRQKEDPDVYSWSLPASHFVRKLGPQPDPNPDPALSKSSTEWNQCFAIEGLTLCRDLEKTRSDSDSHEIIKSLFPGSRRRPPSHPEFHSTPQFLTSRPLLSPQQPSFFEAFTRRSSKMKRFMTGSRSESRDVLDTNDTNESDARRSKDILIHKIQTN